jgi:uncharacterized glyoxalase superfamily protein PhnB
MEHPTVFPALTYDDARAAVDFLKNAFGAEEHAVYTADDGAIRHAELSFGNGLIMFGPAGDGTRVPAAVYIVVDDPDAHHERARAAGAQIVRELHDTDYGSREYGAKDPEGNSWYFGTYQPFAATS